MTKLTESEKKKLKAEARAEYDKIRESAHAEYMKIAEPTVLSTNSSVFQGCRISSVWVNK